MPATAVAAGARPGHGGQRVLLLALQPLAGGWLGKHDHCIVLAAGLVVVSLGFGLTALAGSLAACAGTVAVWTLGEIIAAGLGASIVADLAPPSMRGSYSGVYSGARRLRERPAVARPGMINDCDPIRPH